ncbi:MAG: type VI secretion system baseplate subunit TssK [Bryobacterales bacterium]|nr:type VI secretion system baseplate subunit TssK [Bryobacteraceae bacterium]MDW8129362.1 type VI secretion system baseplate subunit TssK [Bryobacterales bacterium]
MRTLSRVVWSEGMYLGPHHFQWQSRYYEDAIHFATSALWFEPWGLTGCRLDPEALLNGTVAVLHARGIFPDGLLFDMPESDPPPPPRNIAELFPPTRERLTVLLAVPPRRHDGMNCLPVERQNGEPVRYLAENRLLPDENTGRDDKSVRLGRKNIRLMTDTEPIEDWVTLPLARVMRDGAGHFVFDPEFIPPCVELSASDRLMMLLKRLVEILEVKSAALARSSRAQPGFSAGYSAQEVASFWFLHAINSALAPLRHIYLTRRGHPEQLYLELVRLAGALCTFGLESHPRNLPLYDHRHLDECFAELDRHIRFHLEALVPSRTVSIPLRKAAQYFYFGDIADTRCLGPSRWILGIRARLGEAELIAKTPQLVKVCSQQFVPELVRRALPGLVLTHLPVPPSAISARLEWQYFSLTKAGPCWEHMVKTRQVGIYVPGELPEPELELLVILES